MKEGMKAPRPSFLDRYKQMMLATPPQLDSTLKVVLWTAFAFAHDDGTGIYASTNTMMDCAGLPRRTLFRALKTLSDRGYLLDDGWKQHAGGLKTRLRRIDLAALQRDRGTEIAAGVAEEVTDDDAPQEAPDSATGGTPTYDDSAMDGTLHSAMGDTQTKRENQEKSTSLRSDAVASNDDLFGKQKPDPKRLVWREGPELLEQLTGMSREQAAKFLGKLLKVGPAAVVLETIRDCPPETAAPKPYLMAAVKRRVEASREPRLDDSEEAWAVYADTWEVDRDGIKRAVCGGVYIRRAMADLCEAARMDPARPHDWKTPATWLRDGIDFYEKILPAIKERAKWGGYHPPDRLAFFDKFVRSYTGESRHAG